VQAVQAEQKKPKSGESTTHTVAFRVSLVDGQAGVILAESVVDAARRARSAGLKVALIQRIGPILEV
jgi:hypothetical protein